MTISQRTTSIARAFPLLAAMACNLTPIEAATKNIRDGAIALSAGLDSLHRIDPLALNRVLADNEALRTQVTKLTGSLGASITGSGQTELDKVLLTLRIVRTTGSFSVSSYVDDPTVPAWTTNTIVATDSPIDWGMKEPMRKTYFASNEAFEDWMSAVVATATSRADSVCRAYLKTPPVPAGGVIPEITLNSSFGGPGLHVVFVQVTPIAADATGHWSIVGDLVEISGGNVVKTVWNFQMDNFNNRYRNHPIGTVLPNLTRIVRIKKVS